MTVLSTNETALFDHRLSFAVTPFCLTTVTRFWSFSRRFLSSLSSFVSTRPFSSRYTERAIIPSSRSISAPSVSQRVFFSHRARYCAPDAPTQCCSSFLTPPQRSRISEAASGPLGNGARRVRDGEVIEDEEVLWMPAFRTPDSALTNLTALTTVLAEPFSLPFWGFLKDPVPHPSFGSRSESPDRRWPPTASANRVRVRLRVLRRMEGGILVSAWVSRPRPGD
mmetsp:Transcript_44080/g.104944  ORF Transcript_44080/g.104944 Transcript_44080/m.104944 type:complete len:224 (-) Transcript_44080:25-696(-)